MEAVWSRCQPSLRRLKEEIDKGSIGEVMHAESTFGYVINLKRILDRSLGGGTTLDLGKNS